MTLAYDAVIVQTISYGSGALRERQLALLRIRLIQLSIGLAMQLTVPGVSTGANAPRIGKR
jgi:hypothetical protein